MRISKLSADQDYGDETFVENKDTGMFSLTERVPPIHTLSPAPKRGANYPAGFCARIRTQPTELIIAKKFPGN